MTLGHSVKEAHDGHKDFGGRNVRIMKKRIRLKPIEMSQTVTLNAANCKLHPAIRCTNRSTLSMASAGKCRDAFQALRFSGRGSLAEILCAWPGNFENRKLEKCQIHLTPSDA